MTFPRTHEDAVTHKRNAALDAAPKIWNHAVEPDGDTAAAFVNLDPAQGPGEAVFANRPDGQVDVYYYM